MRIAYDNLIDDLNASTLTALTTATGYSVLDIQDQRLSTRWLSSVATSQSVSIELPSYPQFPDNAAGTIYAQDVWASVDGWTSTTVTESGVNGELNGVVIAAGQAAFTKSVVAGTTMSVLVKIKTSEACNFSITGTINGTPNTNILSDSGIIAGSWYVFRAELLGALAAMNLIFNPVSTNTILLVDWVYIGNGVFDSTLTDLSGNGFPATNRGMIPSLYSGGMGLLGDGVSSAILTGDGNYINSDMTIHLVTRKDVLANPAILFSGNLNDDRIYFYNGTINYQRISTVGCSVAATSGTVYTVDLVLTPNLQKLYIDGVFVSQSTITASSYGGIHCWFGSFQNLNSFIQGIIDDCRIYKRGLSDSEILLLHQKKHFVSENYDLAGHWKVNNNLDINTIAILGHNFLTKIDAHIQASSNELDFTGPEVDTHLSINTETILNFFSSNQWYKYWKFTFSGQGSIEIGRLWLGKYITIDPSSLLDFKVIKKRSDQVIYGRNRQKWANIGVGWRQFTFNFPPTEEDMLYSIQQMYDTVGNHSSFIFCNFDTIRDYALVEPCYVSINGDLTFSHDNRMKFTYQLIMEEDK